MPASTLNISTSAIDRVLSDARAYQQRGQDASGRELSGDTRLLLASQIDRLGSTYRAVLDARNTVSLANEAYAALSQTVYSISRRSQSQSQSKDAQSGQSDASGSVWPWLIGGASFVAGVGIFYAVVK